MTLLFGDMQRLLAFFRARTAARRGASSTGALNGRPPRPVAVDDLVERLLAGRLDPADAPPDLAALARLVAAANAPAAPEELVGERAARAEFAAMVQSPPPTLVPRRATMPSKLVSVKAAAAALVALLSIGGVAAAATGMLPGQARGASDQAPPATRGDAAHRVGQAATAAGLDAAAKQGLCRAWQAGQGTDQGRREDSPAFRALAVAAGGAGNVAAYCQDATASGQDGAQGPDAMAAARDGLCRAWQAGEGTDQGRRDDSVAFRALAAAAGGAEKVADYCGETTAGQDRGSRQPSEPPGSATPRSTTVSPSRSGPPPSTGPGTHGQGGPPTTSD